MTFRIKLPKGSIILFDNVIPFVNDTFIVTTSIPTEDVVSVLANICTLSHLTALRTRPGTNDSPGYIQPTSVTIHSRLFPQDSEYQPPERTDTVHIG